MASVFKSPKIPKAPEPIKTPTIDESAIIVENQDKINKRKGKASSIMTGDQSRTQVGGLKSVMGA